MVIFNLGVVYNDHPILNISHRYFFSFFIFDIFCGLKYLPTNLLVRSHHYPYNLIPTPEDMDKTITIKDKKITMKVNSNWDNTTVKNFCTQRLARYQQMLDTMNWNGAECSREYVLGAIKGMSDALASIEEDERMNSLRVWATPGDEEVE